MRTFDDILQIAAERHGGRDAALADIPAPLSPEEIAALPDARFLAAMARGIFQAGISWKVVDAKWPGITEAFHDFEPGPVSMIEGEALDALLSDRRVIRSGPKITAIRDNAVFILDTAAEHGSFARRIADWPVSEFDGLLDWLKRGGARLGGNTGAYMLRAVGKDGYVLSRDVVGRLIAEGVIDKAPTSRRAMAAVQGAFNLWAEQGGQPLTTISRVLARSIG
ncbi:DNA-3-methyladenine glycosylase I [Salipiger sp. PrR002]|uniref:DNA-3-methyladenine glycosylase I n=1 Tax=Salipiger sp. PrR002 TaxID=2706489 RepID=UPI0013B5E47F|nr:DNA-3-methyladenine glycosylase I [Salipiger sp. PrR002]NDW01071.1 3-methyladenine DNA glycosylase [Salipiger sp. PrR002]NDW58526.1 3-methyladenine DNA glycosylase [Salipiger sp. PrR004]